MQHRNNIALHNGLLQYRKINTKQSINNKAHSIDVKNSQLHNQQRNRGVAKTFTDLTGFLMQWMSLH